MIQRDPKLGQYPYDIDRRIGDLEAFTGSKTKAPMDLYVDGDNGDDANVGDQLNPLETIIEAERRIPDVVDHPVKVWVQEASSAYDMPTFRARVLRDTIYVVGAADNDTFHFTELVTGTGDEGSGGDNDRQLVVSGGGLGSNTHRGKTIEILSGAQAGARRMIGDHDDTTVTVSLEFPGALGDGVEFRIVEPSIEVSFPDTLTYTAGASFIPLADNAEANVPALTLINFKGSTYPRDIGNGRVNFFGLDFHGAGLAIPRLSCRSGLLRVGGDFRNGLDLRAQAGVVFGASGDTFWAGWSMGADVGDGLLVEQLDAEMSGVVLDRLICTASEIYLQKPWLFNVGLRVFAVGNRRSSIYVGGTVGFAGGEVSSVIIGTVEWGVDVIGDSEVFLEKVDVTAEGLPAVAARRGAKVVLWNTSNNIEGDIGLLAQEGGRIVFTDGAVSITSTTADTRVIDDGVNTDQVLDDYDADGDYIASGDGSVIQRVKSGTSAP